MPPFKQSGYTFSNYFLAFCLLEEFLILLLTAKSMKFEHFFVQTLHSKIDISHKKMDQLVGFLLRPPLSEICKKIGKMLKYTPHFQSAFGTAAIP